MERQHRQRRRPALSCLECRRRKIKCDRTDPCAHCVSIRAQCTYQMFSSGPVVQQRLPQGTTWSSPASSSVHAPSLAPQNGQPTTSEPRREYDTHSSGPQVSVAAEQNVTRDTSVLDHNDTQQSTRAQEYESGLQDGLQDGLWRRAQRFEQPEASNLIDGLAETSRNILAHQFGLQGTQIILNKSRTLRWSHWIGIAQEVQFALMCTVEYPLTTLQA